jgi:hypothetical protein
MLLLDESAPAVSPQDWSALEGVPVTTCRWRIWIGAQQWGGEMNGCLLLSTFWNLWSFGSGAEKR